MALTLMVGAIFYGYYYEPMAMKARMTAGPIQ